MTRRRQDFLAEIEEELGNKECLEFLASVQAMREMNFEAENWVEWLETWRGCSDECKQQLLPNIFALFRQNRPPEWWYPLLLMFEKDLVHLKRALSKIPYKRFKELNNDIWDMAFTSFLQNAAPMFDLVHPPASLSGIRTEARRMAFKDDRDARRHMAHETSVADMDNFVAPATGEENRMQEARAKACLFIVSLPERDRKILEEVFLEKQTREACAAAHALSRDQVKRVISRVRNNLAAILGLPLSKCTARAMKLRKCAAPRPCLPWVD